MTSTIFSQHPSFTLVPIHLYQSHPMLKYLAILLFAGACVDQPHPVPPIENKKGSVDIADTVVTNPGRGIVPTNYPALVTYLRSADSIVIVSHDSPNMSLRDKKTGKYRQPPNLIVNGQVSDSAVHERKRLSRKSILELSQILTTPAVDDVMRSTCFQPRHAVVVYKNKRLAYLDICFDCYGLNSVGDMGSAIVFNQLKYRNMYRFFWKQGIRYNLD